MRKKNSLSQLILVVIVLLSCVTPGFPQQITGTYTTSTPEATLFFLDPGYLNPAFGRGVLGMQSNPAGLQSVQGNQASFAFGTSQASTGQFTFLAVDQSQVYEPILLDTRLKIKEPGGLGAVGFAHQSGNWVWGLSLQQARTGGLAVQARGSVDLTTRFDLNAAITKQIYDSLPVDEIPITWDVNTRGTLSLHSTPAELSLSMLPVMAAVAYQKGHFAIGAGLTYINLYSSNDSGEITTTLNGGADITGTPTGLDPITGQPWRGSVNARVDIQDEPLRVKYKFDISGQRIALTLGGTMNYKLLSLGLAYTQGFKGNIRGSYDLMSIVTNGLPAEDVLSDVELDLSLQPEISGTAKLSLLEFQKDTLVTANSGGVSIGGYRSISFGAHFLAFGAFFGADIPQTYPDFYSAYFGVYTDFPLPWLPVRLNLGFISRTDGIMDDENKTIPFRMVSHIGGGVAFRLPTHRWFNIGEQPSWLRLGVRSSLTSYALEAVEKQIDDPSNKRAPSMAESLAGSIGLTIPF